MHPNGQTFLITGGGSGLGAATARRLAQLGARLVIADLAPDAGARTAREIGPASIFIATDVTVETQVAAAVEAALHHFGALHGAICCAGIAIAERLVGRDGPHSRDSFARVVEVNLTGTFNVMRLAAQAMATNTPQASGERGVLINTASIAAYEGQVGQIAYSASKAGVVGMTLPAARELARLAIRVVAIAPGLFETPMMAGMSDEVRASLGAQVPFPSRLGEPDEFAALVVHIIENPMLNGAVIRLDGALRMAPR
jgi:NAD(P)-dependent dehydrogenase (short-subunit alcohol dehydrogenase family)